MTTTETCHYRGYDIVPTHSVVELVCGASTARVPTLPLMSHPTLSTLAPLMEEAVDEAKQSIDRLLSRVK